MKGLNKIKQYALVASVTLIAVMVYLVCFGFKITQPTSLDIYKPMDSFINILVENDGQISGNPLQACDYNIQYLIMFIIGKISGSMWAGVNVYYILSFFLISAAMYWYLRKLSISNFVAVAIAVITAFLPFHTDRGQGQLLTSNFFLIPLFMGMLYELIYEKKQDNINKFYIVIMILAPFMDIRACVMMIILFGILLIHRYDFKVFKNTMYYLCPLTFFTILAGLLSSILKSTDFHGSIELAKTEGLRILDMLMPVRYHVVRRLSDFRLKYDIEFSASGESGLNTMGLLISAGFILGMLVLFYGKKADKRIMWLSWINIIVIIISNIHGLNLLFECFGIHVIYWNRMGIFILTGSAAVTALLADDFKNVLGKRFGTLITSLGMAFLFLAAFFELLLRNNIM